MNNKHLDTRRRIIVIKKGQLNPADASAKPISPKVSRDVPEGWVKEHQSRTVNAVADFRALFEAQSEVI